MNPAENMNRADLMRTLAAAEALVDAVKRKLKDGPAQIFEREGTAVCERVPGVGTLSTALSTDAAVVTDDARFVEWVAAQFPTEVETVTRVRNPDWLKQLLTRLEPVDPDHVLEGEATSCMDSEGTIIPGVVWFRGGRFLYAAVKIDKSLKVRYAADAAAFVERGVPMDALGPVGQVAIEGTATVSDQA